MSGISDVVISFLKTINISIIHTFCQCFSKTPIEDDYYSHFIRFDSQNSTQLASETRKNWRLASTLPSQYCLMSVCVYCKAMAEFIAGCGCGCSESSDFMVSSEWSTG